MPKQNLDLLLWKACEKQNLPEVQSLLSNGADCCTIVEGKFNAAIHQAIIYSNDPTDILQTLFTFSTVTVDVNVRDTDDETPLLLVCRKGFVNSAKLLLEKGADVTIKNKLGHNVIHKAVYSNSVAMMTECLSWNGIAGINDPGRKNQTPLIIACVNGMKNVIGILLTSGADMYLEDAYGSTAYWYARKYDYKEIMYILDKHTE